MMEEVSIMGTVFVAHGKKNKNKNKNKNNKIM